MASSKFSSPFFKKSPLHGAYASGADGIVPVSYDNIHKDFQQGVADNVANAYAKNNKCSEGAEYYFDKDGAKFPCDSESKDPLTLADVKELNRISADATIAEQEDIMIDINSTGDFLESEKKKDAAKLKQQKKEEEERAINSMNAYFNDKRQQQEYRNQKK
tara:strand:- start:54 stop:536 length:483 start_codon:yes stop_codon:yes gene_type:complete